MQCINEPKEKYCDEPRHPCKQVPEWDEPCQICQNIPKMVCQDVPKEKCWDEPRQECHHMPREECHEVLIE